MDGKGMAKAIWSPAGVCTWVIVLAEARRLLGAAGLASHSEARVIDHIQDILIRADTKLKIPKAKKHGWLV
jgi:hypothetical protein